MQKRCHVLLWLLKLFVAGDVLEWYFIIVEIDVNMTV
jgi:hypothetical protein